MIAIASRRRSAIVVSLMPHRDRVAAERALVQDLDLRALDEAEFEQPPLELGRGQAWAPALTAMVSMRPQNPRRASPSGEPWRPLFDADGSAMTMPDVSRAPWSSGAIARWGQVKAAEMSGP